MNLLEHITSKNKNENFVTMISKKNEIGFCFKINKKNNCFFVHVLTGGISEKSFIYLGRFFAGGKVFLVTPDIKDTIEHKAFAYLFKHVENESVLNQNYTIKRNFTKIVY